MSWRWRICIGLQESPAKTARISLFFREIKHLFIEISIAEKISALDFLFQQNVLTKDGVITQASDRTP